MNDIDIHQLAAAYALDAVDERERAEFEAHYPTCPVCPPEVAGFRETLSKVAASVAVAPPPSLKSNVMAEHRNAPVNSRLCSPTRSSTWLPIGATGNEWCVLSPSQPR